MTKRMLIDATQPEETRVAVIAHDRLDTYDFDSAVRKQIKGNIFLAKVTRVEPSLQACFVEYGGNRQGFLAFTEIHPDYYRIPVEDREALLAEEAAWDEEDDEGDDTLLPPLAEQPDAVPAEGMDMAEALDEPALKESPVRETDLNGLSVALDHVVPQVASDADDDGFDMPQGAAPANLEDVPKDTTVEQVGGEAEDDEAEQHSRARRLGRLRRRYKIQEVIKRRQIMLVQAVKEERGNKGAAMTTYISLPGRYCVLMPNSPRGGGISRKITDQGARRKMKDLLSELDVPQGMSVILRTAGLTRTKLDIKRDLEYLLQLWDEIRRETLQSVAPALIYEEADIFKRTIRDLYSSDTHEIIVAGELGYKKVKTFMRQMIPNHVKRVQYYRDPLVPLFQRYRVEEQIDNVFSPRVELRSGGYIIINPTEALVSIDVNSGRATRERHIDDTALKTNMEAAEEIARQLRLRDLGGLVVIDFIDMESGRHNAKVERRLRDAMAGDRARIEIGRISAFGLLELSRQRLHPSLTETHFQCCAHCSGTGLIRTTDSAAVVVMRAIESEAVKGRSIGITANVPQHVAVYLLNHKRQAIMSLEECFGIRIAIRVDEALSANDYTLSTEKGQPRPKNVGGLLPVPHVEGVDDAPLPEEEDGEGEAFFGTGVAQDDTRDDDGQNGDENGDRNGRRGRRGGRRNWRERRNGRGRRDDGDMAVDGAVTIPIIEGQPDSGVFGDDTSAASFGIDGDDNGAVSNPSADRRPGRGGRGRRPDRRGRGPRPDRHADETGSDRADSSSQQQAPHADGKVTDLPPRAPRPSRAVSAEPGAASATASSGAANNDHMALADDGNASKNSKRGWWQKLID